MDHHNHNAMVGNMTVHYQPTNSSFSRPANWSETMNHGHHVQGQALQMDHGTDCDFSFHFYLIAHSYS